MLTAAAWAPGIASSSTALEAGITWLEERQGGDGAFEPGDSTALPEQAAAEAEAALLAHDAEAFSAGPATVEGLAGLADDNTEFLALAIRQGYTRGEPAPGRIEALLQRRNRDGGFAEAPGHPSSIQATAFALMALNRAGHGSDNTVAQAVAFLVERQADDGGWRELEGASRVYTSALATRALSRHASDFALAAPLDAAAAFLVEQRAADGGYGTAWETAHALLALLPITTREQDFVPALQWLREAQGADGGWAGDLYATGLAARALVAAERLGGGAAPPDPDTGTVQGRVVNAADGTSISQAGIAVEGDETLGTVAASDGAFRLALPADEPVTLVYTAAGFAGATQVVEVSGGGYLDVGRIALEPLPDTGRLEGRITGRDTGEALGDAVVTVIGDAEKTVEAGADGGYAVSLPGGAYTVTVEVPGYHPAAASFDLAGGQRLDYSPALAPDEQPATLTGELRSAATGEPIAGAAITSGALEATTDGSGRFELADIEAGEYTFSVAAEGYRGLDISLLLPPDQVVELGVIELEPLQPPDTVTVTGAVIDQQTGEPVPGASVSSDGQATIADEDGRYTLASLPVGDLSLAAAAEGYRDRSLSINVETGGTVTVPITLEPQVRGGLRLSNLRSDQVSYEAHREVGLAVDLENTGPDSLVTRLYIAVFDGGGTLLSEEPVMPVLVDGDADSEALEQALEEARIRLEPGEAITDTFSWFTEAHPPGDYEIRVRAYEAFDGELLGERSRTVRIEPTQRVELVSVRPDPLYMLQGTTGDLGFTVLLQHRSNQSFSVDGTFDLLHPDGSVLRSESFSADLAPDEVNHRTGLPGEPFTPEAAGEHAITVHSVQGPEPLTVHGQSLFVAPGTRLEIQQDRAPGVVPPDGDHRIDIEIRLEGKEE